jgi:Bifunctional DNA primase/polymerase, N-terminal/Primase C terminal 2 (PriCT-2)
MALVQIKAIESWRIVMYAPTVVVAPADPAKRWRIAVRAAIRAYEMTGRMRDAALAYAANGVPVVPCDPITKVPIPRRDPDPTGKFPDGIPGTGGIYKATCDPEIIRRWWNNNPWALIGVPMGERSGVFCADIDTPEDHDDGVSGWTKIAAEHDPIETREHRSATDGPHLIFNWRPGIGCSSGDLPRGIEIKGQGGYIAVPPSRRKRRFYTVHHDIDPTDAPQWLIDLIKPKRQAAWTGSVTTADFEELADALRFIENDDLSWDEWTSWGLAIFAATGGKGFILFDEFSQRSYKYDQHKTLQRWREITGSPPNRTGAEKIFKIARENGWVQKASPSFTTNAVSADEARSRTENMIEHFLDGVINGFPPLDEQKQAEYDSLEIDPPPSSWAALIETGVGKTERVIEQLAKRLNDLKGTVIYAVPRHKLGMKIEKQFAKHGIIARVFRGRNADDPNNRGKKMCLNLKAVELAIRCRTDVSKSCCKSGSDECVFLKRCGYKGQDVDAETVQVWIVASDMLFHTQKVFGNPVAVIIDEGIWQKGIRGVEREKNEIDYTVAIDSLITGCEDNTSENFHRQELGEALMQQRENGGLKKKVISDKFIYTGDCGDALVHEWRRVTKITKQLALRPGMSNAQIRKLARHSNLIDSLQHTRKIIKIWEELREMLRNGIAVSGRLKLDQVNGQRVIRWCGVEEIKKQFQVPTLLLDATLPALEILQVYHENVEIVADIKVRMPACVQIRQILHAPTSANKMTNEKHLEEVRRYILQRWFETGCKPSLVICQMKVEEYLKDKLPKEIAIEHYNDVAGLDIYKDVRLLILIGRTAPGPRAMEIMAGALSGKQPKLTRPGPDGYTGYPRIKQGIRVQDGSGRSTRNDQHPDAFVEGVRWLVHEGELLQAMGRGRGINRTDDNPLDIDLMFDACLPITVKSASGWKRPSLAVEMLAEGAVLTSRVDMAKAWPGVFKNDMAAKRAAKKSLFRKIIAHWQRVTYQPMGPKMNKRTGYFDPARVPDPKVWLESRLGPLKVFKPCH